MSHIDSFSHSLVGNLFGLPVYQALEDIEGDFRCKKAQLLVGGGSGEFPVMVLENSTAMVARFLSVEFPELVYSDENVTRWTSAFEPFLEFDNSKLLTFYDWDIRTYVQFYELCTEAYSFHREKLSIENWLILGFGEFIFFSMPELCNDILNEIPQPYKKFRHVRYNNIMLIPPNMPVYANGGNHFFPRSEN